MRWKWDHSPHFHVFFSLTSNETGKPMDFTIGALIRILLRNRMRSKHECEYHRTKNTMKISQWNENYVKMIENGFWWFCILINIHKTQFESMRRDGVGKCEDFIMKLTRYIHCFDINDICDELFELWQWVQGF